MSDPGDPKVFIIEKRCDEKGMRITNFDKVLVAVIIGIVFFLIAMPLAFKLSNKAATYINWRTTNANGVPTTTGLLIHTIVFIFAVRLLMK